MIVAAYALSSQLPKRAERAAHEVEPGVFASIGEGLRFVRANRGAASARSSIDLCAMTFGMPRALFPVLAVSVYHAGASGTGACIAAVSAGAADRGAHDRLAAARPPAGPDRRSSPSSCGALRSPPPAWPARSRSRARCWRSRAPPTRSARSAAPRSTRSVTPDAMRGRMSSVFSLVVTSGPRLGDVESGTVAALSGVRCVGRLRRPRVHRLRRDHDARVP